MHTYLRAPDRPRAPKDIVERICNSMRHETMLDDLTEFAKRTKLSGSETEFASFEYLKSRLDSLGYKTDLILHDAYISLPGEARLRVGDQAFRCITHSFSAPTAGMTATIVDIGSTASPECGELDIVQKVALLNGIAFPDTVADARLAGVAALIFINPAENRHEMCISPVWGNPDLQTIKQLPKVPVISVNRADGEIIRALLASNPELPAVIHADVGTGWRKTPLLVAEMFPPAAAADCPFVMFSGHHDTWYYGLMDNGAANATMLAVAEAMAGESANWRRGLRLCFWSGHSHGRYSGSAWYADTRFQELEARCAVHVNVDSTGGMGASVLIDTPVSDELFDIAEEAVLAQAGQNISGHRLPRAGDQSFWGIGVPSIFMGLSEQPVGSPEAKGVSYLSGRSTRQGAGFGWWWHTEHDTIDKIDLDNLLRDTRVYGHALVRLLCDDALPLDYSRWIETFEAVIDDLQKKTGDLLSYEAVYEQLSELRARWNFSLSDRQRMAVSRALVPLDYTRGDRFVHDPARSAEPYPVLNPIRDLACLETGSEARLFAAVAARQTINRVVSMIGAAVIALPSHGKVEA